MSRFGTGCVEVASRDIPVIIPNGQIATVTHNANKRAEYILVIKDNGQLVCEADGFLVTTNGPDDFKVQNTSGLQADVRFYAYFEIFSPQKSGEIPASAVVVAP